MSYMDQSAIDALLNSVEQQAADVSAKVAATPAEGSADALAGVAATLDDIAGEMATPTPKSLPDHALAGEFDAPTAPSPVIAGHPSDARRLLAIEVPVIVLLGKRRMTVGEVMRLGVGAIVEFNKSADEELDLLVNNKAIGRGHAVKVGENFGIKLSKVEPVRETIRKLGGAGD
jgi:flagellar motor switch protein FliN